MEWLLYKNRKTLFVVNYNQTYSDKMRIAEYQMLRMESIKSIYINEEFWAKRRYGDPLASSRQLDGLGCVVFIETYPENKVPAKGGKGVRKTWVDGYSEPVEFYHLDYSILPKEEDHRQTLYWNPEVMPDEAGNAQVSFYNNSRCRKLKITAETISVDGIIGVFSE